MPRLWILPALGLVAILGFACGDSGDDLSAVVTTATPVASALSASPSLTGTASPTSASPSLASSPEPVADWVTYTDAAAGFTLAVPAGSSAQEFVNDYEAMKGHPPFEQRNVTFVTRDGLSLLGVAVIPNPDGLSVEDWIRTYPGWPCDPHGSPTCDPQEVTVSGETGIRFSIDTLGDPAATVCFAHNGVIFSLSGNVYGSGESRYPPAILESDFEYVVNEFRFAK